MEAWARPPDAESATANAPSCRSLHKGHFAGKSASFSSESTQASQQPAASLCEAANFASTSREPCDESFQLTYTLGRG